MHTTQEWNPPPGWRRICTVDAHAAGEPLRIVTEGWPPVPGATMGERRRYAREHQDGLRRALIWEPRGHADMYGCILTEPATDDGDAGVLFLHNEGFSTMCGHGVIGLVTVGLECGLLRPRSEEDSGRATLRLDTPAGRVIARALFAAGEPETPRVERVSFQNVPSFVLEPDLPIDVPGIGRIRCDIAFGGAYYAYVDAEELGLTLAPRDLPRIVDVGMRIKRAVMEAYEIVHPEDDADLAFLYGTILVGPATRPGVHSRNVCVFANGEVDRSPTGTGVSGRAALHHRRGDLPAGERVTIESIIGSTFDVRVVAETRVGRLRAIVPEVTGSAHITGRHEFLIDPTDPLQEGFLLR